MTSTTNPENPSSSSSTTTTNTPFPLVLWRFTRPHTLIGSFLSIPSLHLFASPTLSTTALLSYPMFLSILSASVPALLMNLYITGLNQITDVEIDRVNKPKLPLPSGQMTIRTAIIVVLLSVCVSLGMTGSWYPPSYNTRGLQQALWGSMVLGTVYSLPPLRLKRFPILAAFCIVAVRGMVINAGFFAHARAVMGIAGEGGGTGLGLGVWRVLLSEGRCAAACAFFALFGVVIALMKDVPDVKGDRLFQIRSFTVRAGPEVVFRAMRRLLEGLFWGVGLVFGGLASRGVGGMGERICRLVVAFCCVLAGRSVRKEAKGVDPEDSREVYGYYMHLWKLFYLSYLVLPFAR